MGIISAEAIVLRSNPLSESDLIATLFTKELGKIRVVAKAARRIKSRFRGVLESLSHVQVDFYEREHRDLAYLSRCDLEESFFDLQSDYISQVCCAYWVEVVDAVCQDREANPKVFRLILATLRGRRQGLSVVKLMPYFNFWILRLAGFLPNLKVCFQCNSQMSGGGRFFQPEKRIYCRNCKPEGGILLTPDLIDLARLFSVQPITGIDQQNRSLGQALGDLNLILERILLEVVERPIKSLGLLKEMRASAGTWA